MHDKAIRRRRAVLALLVAVSLILLTAYFGESSSSPLHVVQRGVVAALSPVQDGASKVLSPVRDIAGFISSTVDAKSQNTQLKRQVAQLRQGYDRLLYEDSQVPEYQRELSLATTDDIKAYDPVSASVIGKNALLWYDTIEVNAGSSDDVHVGDPVVGDGGLVGDVATVGGDYSIVTLLTAPKFAAGAMAIDADHTSYSGILQPQPGNPQELLLSYLPAHAQISQGDPVVTSGFREAGNQTIESLYPGGIPIGTVSNADTEDTLINSRQVDVTPVVDLQHLTVVQILTKPHPTTESASLP